MEIEYSKDLHHNYMIIRGQTYDRESSYCIRMLEADGLNGILSPDCIRQDDCVFYYYDITAKQSLISLLARAPLSVAMVKHLIGRLVETIEKAYEYLLDEKGFVLSPETIFLDLNTGEYELCYLPCYGRDVKEQMCSILEFIMNKVDYNDKEAVLLVYNLYAAGREEEYTFDQLFKLLHNPDQHQPSVGGGRSNSLRSPDNTSKDSQSGRFPVERTIPGRKPSNPLRIIKDEAQNSPSQAPRTIPVMPEKVFREQEKACYPIKTYIYTAACTLAAVLLLLLCIKTKLCYRPLGHRIDYTKLFAILLILFCSCGYLMMKLWDKKNRITKMITLSEYRDPMSDVEKGRSVINREEANGEAILGSDTDESTYRQEFLWQEKTDHRLKPKENEEKHVKKHIEKLKEEYVEKYEEEEEVVNPTCLLNGAEPDYCCKLKPLEEGGYDTITIRNIPFFIGKLRKNVDYCLKKEVVSRYHAKITRENDRYFITDLNSTNGTFLNGEALMTYQQKELNSGDVVSFANIRYQFMV